MRLLQERPRAMAQNDPDGCRIANNTMDHQVFFAAKLSTLFHLCFYSEQLDASPVVDLSVSQFRLRT